MPFTTDQNISFPLDDDYYREIEIEDEDTGEPLDLTDATVKAFVRASPGSALVYTLTVETNGGLSVPNARGGVAAFNVPRSAQTAMSMTAGNRVYALKVLKSGVEKTVATGRFDVTPSNGVINA